MKRQLKMYPLANIIANYCNNDSLYLWLSPLNTTLLNESDGSADQ